MGYQRKIKKDMMRANGHKTKKTVPVSGGYKSISTMNDIQLVVTVTQTKKGKK